MHKYTHLAKIYGFYCWYNVHTNEIKGTTWYRELIISLYIFIDVTFDVSDGVYIELINELQNE